MTIAPRPKRLTRKSRLQRQTLQQRAEQAEQARAKHRDRRHARGRLAPVLEQTLQARAGGRCELCGEALAGRCQRHHRKLRSQGGLDQVVNLVLLHPNCHNAVHMNPEWSRQNGWIVPSHRQPATVPILLHGDRRVRLVLGGGYEAIA